MRITSLGALALLVAACAEPQPPPPAEPPPAVSTAAPAAAPPSKTDEGSTSMLYTRTRAYFTDFHENGGPASLIDAFIADGMQYHVPGKTLDAAATRASATALRDGLSDIKVTLVKTGETEDTLDFDFTYEGTKKDSGEAFKTGPTAIRYRFDGDAVVEGWVGGAIPGFTE